MATPETTTLPVRLVLKPQPDGLGYIYGTATREDGSSWRIDIMPPFSAWRGQIKQTGRFAPHATDYVLYIDGKESARAPSLEQVKRTALDHLSSAPRSD